MADTGRTLDELNEALEITDDDLLYVVRSPYSEDTSLKLKASVLKDYLLLEVGAGNVVGPASSLNDNLVGFNGTTGKLIKDSGVNIAGLRNRTTHTGQQAWSTINATPTTLAGYGILDAAAKFMVQDTTVDITDDFTTLNFEGDVSVAEVAGVVTVTIVAAAGAPSSATYIVQTPTGALSSEQALSLLGTGLMKSTTATGVVSIAVAGTDYLGVPASSVEGDILYRDGVSWTRLPRGANKQYLRATGSTITYSALVPEGVVTLTDAATIAVDASLLGPGKIAAVVITNNRTLGNPTGAVDGQELAFRVSQDGTGGYTLALDTKFRFSDVVPSLTIGTAANKPTYIRTRYHEASDKFDVLEVVVPV